MWSIVFYQIHRTKKSNGKSTICESQIEKWKTKNQKQVAPQDCAVEVCIEWVIVVVIISNHFH